MQFSLLTSEYTLPCTANTLAREAERIKAEAEELLAGRQELIGDVEAQLDETRELVSRGQEQQQITAELLADTFTAEGQAKEAIKTAEKTLSEARDTLTILEGGCMRPCLWGTGGVLACDEKIVLQTIPM